jgi:hypothetical protein
MFISVYLYITKEIMRSIVLAIISVGLVQVSFQVYMAIDRSDAEYRAMRSSEIVERIPTADLTIAGLPEAEDDSPGLPNVVHSSVSTPRPHPPSARNPTLAVFTPRRHRETRPLFQPVVIHVRTVEVPKLQSIATAIEKRGETRPPPVLTRREGPPSDNRSLIAKAIPMIKKPFEWIKGLASKLR